MSWHWPTTGAPTIGSTARAVAAPGPTAAASTPTRTTALEPGRRDMYVNLGLTGGERQCPGGCSHHPQLVSALRCEHRLEGRQPAAAVALDGPLVDPELGRRLAHRQPEPVAQHDHLALLLRQRLERVEEGRPLLDGRRHGCAVLGQVVGGPFAPPRPAGLVDVGAHHDLPAVGLLAALLPDARPRDVELGEGRLEQVVGLVPVAAQGVRDPAQVGLPGGDELAEGRVAVGAPHRTPSPEEYCWRAQLRNAVMESKEPGAATTSSSPLITPLAPTTPLSPCRQIG